MATPNGPRMAWIDLIKGTSVVLVVFMHVVLTLTATVGATPVSGFWAATTTLLEPLRMPVFFVVSGMLAAGAVARPWSLTRRRTIGIGYLYVVWTAILIVVLAASGPAEGPLATLGTFPGTLLFVASGYWYLFALVAFFAIARVCRNLPPLLVVAIAAVPNLLRPFTTDTISDLHSGSLAPAMVMNLVFFLAGAYYKHLFAGITRIANWDNVAVLAVVLVTAGVWRQHTPELWAQTFLPLSVGWIVLAIMTGNLLTRFDGPRRFGAFMGPRTLPVFVIQFPLLHLIEQTLRSHPGALAHPLVQLVYPVGATTVLVALSLAAYSAARGTGFWLLFEAPAALTSAPERATVAPPRRAAPDMPAPLLLGPYPRPRSPDSTTSRGRTG